MAMCINRCYIDKVGSFHVNQTSVCLDPHHMGEVDTIKLALALQYNIFTDRTKAVLLLWIIFVIYVSCLSCFLVCSLPSYLLILSSLFLATL